MRLKGALLVRARRRPTGGMTLAGAIERGYQDRWSRRKDGDQAVARLSRVAALIGPETPIASIDLAKVELVRRRLASAGLKGATINRHLAPLKTLLRMAEEWGEISERPPVRMEIERPERRRALTDEEIGRILAATESAETRRLIIWLADTGMRLGEALSLTSADIRDGCAWLSDTKSGRPRVVPLTRRALSVIAGVEGRLFKGGPWKFARHFKAAVRRAGIDPKGVCLHALRHTCCTNLVTRGAGLAAAGAVLGHSTATMTARYAHLDIAALRQAVGLLERPK